MAEFIAFPKLARLSRDCVITEKLDGTNAAVVIEPIEEPGSELVLANMLASVGSLGIWAQSRKRLLTPGKTTDNYGFAQWVQDHAEELRALGPGHHYGEWYGQGIQRNYGLEERRFALFNVSRWGTESERPACCEVVPTIYTGIFTTAAVEAACDRLREYGSLAVKGFMDPEGVVIYHTAAGQLFKKTLKDDGVPKSLLQEAA